MHTFPIIASVIVPSNTEFIGGLLQLSYVRNYMKQLSSQLSLRFILKHLPVAVLVSVSNVRPTHPRSRDSQDQETFLAPSSIRNFDKECSNQHPFLYMLRSNGVSCRKIK